MMSDRALLWVDEPVQELPSLKGKVISMGDLLTVLSFRSQLRRILRNL